MARSRRAALRLAGSTAALGLAGCLGSGARDGRDGTRRKEGTPPDEGFRFAAEAVAPFADEHPGRVRIRLANATDDPVAMQVLWGIAGPLTALAGERRDGDGSLIVLPEGPVGTSSGAPPNDGGGRETVPGAPCISGGVEYAIPDEPTDGCWRPACEYATVISSGYVGIGSGEALEWTYAVLDRGNDECLPPGTYEFDERAPVARGRVGGMPGNTPAGGPTHVLEKRMLLALSADRRLSAEGRATLEPADGSGPPSTSASTPYTIGDGG